MRIRSLFLLLFLMAAAGRLAYTVHHRTFLRTGVGGEMEHAAATLARHGFLGDAFGPGTGPTAHVVPIYPLLLAAIYRVFGWEGAGRVIQELLAILATSVAIALLPLLARKVKLPTTAGVAAAIALAVLPLHLWIETSGAWEQPFAALALLGILWSAISLHDSGWRSAKRTAAFGAMVGAASLLSASLLPVGIGAALGSWWCSRGARTHIAGRGLLAAAALLLVLSPWTIRNYAALGGFVPLRSNLGLELSLGNNDAADGVGYDPSWDRPGDPHLKGPFGDPTERAKLVAMGELPYMKARMREGTDWIRAHPARFGRLTVTRFRLFWFPRPDMWEAPSPLRRTRAAIAGVIGAGALFGLAGLFIRRHPYRWIILGTALGGSAIYYLTHASVRYRYPLVGLSTVLAAWVMLEGMRMLATRARRT